MTPSDPRAILAALGVEDVIECSPLPSGLGGTLLWKAIRDTAPRQLVLRVFPGGHDHLPEREAAAHRIAITGGVPAPRVINTGRVGDDTALVMAWSPGTLAAEQVLSSSPAEAYTIGAACGRTLAALHRAPLSVGARASLGPDASWLHWSRGEHTERIHALLDRRPPLRREALLHLDYHPENVLLDGGEVSGVLDWANARLGPPEADLARAAAIQWLIPHHPRIATEAHPALARYGEGLLAGHRAVFGPTSDDPIFTAWALSAQLSDLQRKVGSDGFWISAAALEQLRAAVERAFALAEN